MIWHKHTQVHTVTILRQKKFQEQPIDCSDITNPPYLKSFLGATSNSDFPNLLGPLLDELLIEKKLHTTTGE